MRIEFWKEFEKIIFHLQHLSHSVHSELQHECNRCTDLISQLKFERHRLSEIEKQYATDISRGSSFDDFRNPSAFFEAFQSAKNSIRVYCSRLVKDAKSNEISRHIILHLKHENTDLKLSIQAFVAHHLFLYFENPSFEPNGASMLCENREDFFLDSYKQFKELKFRSDYPNMENAEFFKFSNSKFSSIASFFSIWLNQESIHKFLLGSTTLRNAFINAAEDVWALHLLAFSFYPPIEIIRVVPNQNIKSSFCEVLPRSKSVETLLAGGDGHDETHPNHSKLSKLDNPEKHRAITEELEVFITIMPGFRCGKGKDLIVKPVVVPKD